jgi:TRAP transporter 4TM/12TM fusion protein
MSDDKTIRERETGDFQDKPTESAQLDSDPVRSLVQEVPGHRNRKRKSVKEKSAEELEHEGNRRNLTGPVLIAVNILMVASSLFHIYTGGFGMMSSLDQRSIHLLFMLSPTFLFYALSSRKTKAVPWYDYLFFALSLACCLFILLTWKQNTLRVGDTSLWSILFGTVLVLLTIEAGRRTCGSAMALIALIMFLYIFLGKYLPWGLGHRGYSLSRAIPFLTATTEGVFGTPLGVSASMIVLFVIFGEILSATGAGKFIIDITYSGAGRLRGGAGKTATVASALMGMISGAPVANVVATGTFTIPLMKRSGFDANLSAAICAIASAGGILMPPVMGTAAFIMAEYLNMSYGAVCLCAIIPSLLYYMSIFLIVDLEAVKKGLRGLPKKDLPSFTKTLKEGWLLIIPIIALIYFLCISWSASKAVFWSIILLAAISFIKKSTRLTWKKAYIGLVNGSKQAISVAVACATAGVIVGSLGITGLGIKFSAAVISLSGGHLFLALVLTMFACLVLGMGMPASAVYILAAALLAAPLQELGLPALAAHFFIFYFSVISCITPPVALTAYAAAGIAKTDPGRAGWTAFAYGILAYIIPFVFVYDQVLLAQGTLLQCLWAVATAACGIFGIGVALEGYLFRRISWYQRIILFIAGVACLPSDPLLSLGGIAVIVIVLIPDFMHNRRIRAASA